MACSGHRINGTDILLLLCSYYMYIYQLQLLTTHYILHCVLFSLYNIYRFHNIYYIVDGQSGNKPHPFGQCVSRILLLLS